VDETHAYVTVAGGTENLYRVEKSGGVPLSLVPGAEGGEGQVVLDGDYVYWANSIAGQVRRLNKTTLGAPEVIGESLSPRHIVLDATHVFWTDFGASVDEGVILRAPKAPSGAGPFEVANSLSRPTGIRLVGEDLFVANRDEGALFRVPKTGGMPEILYAGDADANFQGWSVAYDGAFVYWYSTPELLRMPASGMGTPTVVADQVDSGRDMVFVDGMLFWCAEVGAEWQIWVIDVASPGSARMLLNKYQCHGMAVDESFIYFTTWNWEAGPEGGLFRLARPPTLP
jgi:hypothetical protein